MYMEDEQNELSPKEVRQVAYHPEEINNSLHFRKWRRDHRKPECKKDFQLLRNLTEITEQGHLTCNQASASL